MLLKLLSVVVSIVVVGIVVVGVVLGIVVCCYRCSRCRCSARVSLRS